MKYRIYFWMIFSFINVVALYAHAEVVYYTLDNVTLEDQAQMTGIFSWTYEIGDFENGEGEFIFLDIPRHAGNDLGVTFDIQNT